MTRPNEKIRPPTHSSFQKSDPSLRAEAEDDLPDLAQVPDPLAKRVDTPADAVNANDPQPPPPVQPGWHPSAFAPDDAAELRREMNEPNSVYGRPYRPNPAEVLLNRYNIANAALKAAYAGTRNEPPALVKEFLEAKEAMIKAGLMKGDV
jgi:hypothetical protein